MPEFKAKPLFPGDPGPNNSLSEIQDYKIRAELFLDQIPNGLIPEGTLNLLHVSTEGLGGSSGMGIRAFIEYANQTIDAAGFDAVTGLFNRKSLDRILESNVAEARRGIAPLALIVVDIDNFKQINDSAGHVVGDENLQKISEVLKAMTRETDVVARYGGDELAIIMPDAFQDDEGQLLKRVETIRKAIEVVAFNKGSKIGTASIGVAVWQEGMDATKFIEKADQAAFKSKNSGKNKVTYLE